MSARPPKDEHREPQSPRLSRAVTLHAALREAANMNPRWPMHPALDGKSRAQSAIRTTLFCKRRWLHLALALSACIFLAALWARPEDEGKVSAGSMAAAGKAEAASPLEVAYRERARRNPQDVEALRGIANLQTQRGDYADAIASYRRVLDLAPDDHDAEAGLGRSLAFNKQYDAALGVFRQLLESHPGDTDALEGLARVQMWSGHPAEALPIFLDLSEHSPGNPEYALGLARAQISLHRYSNARRTLTTILATYPGSRDVQMQLAYLDLAEGNQAGALRRFNRLIAENPADREALEGNVRIAYFRGDLAYAHDLAAKIVTDDPSDVAALLLLARLERSMHNRGQAREVLDRVETADPGNPEAGELGARLRDDSRPTLHTAASYAREIGSGDPSGSEDLTAFGYDTTLGFFTLPRTDSYVSVSYLPSESPSGGIEGAVGPAQILYRQTTYLSPQFTARGGIGLVRFGPGELVGIPTQAEPITSAGNRLLGFGSIRYAPKKNLILDITAARAGITYTPTAVRLGVMQDLFSAKVDYHFCPKTDLSLEPFVAEYSTISYEHAVGVAGTNPAEVKEADSSRDAGITMTFERSLIRKSNISLDIGYAGFAYRLIGGMDNPYMGFFNPGFYQRHYLTSHVSGRVHGPLGYDISLGAGVQQIEHATPFKPALLFSPQFTLRASPRLSLTLGYTHYDSAQSLGALRGNAVRLTTDWRF